MIKIAYRTAIGVTAALIFLGACSDSDDEASGSNAAILKFIPADSPYVFAMTEPLPDDLMDKVEPAVDEMLGAYQVVLHEVMKSGLGHDADSETREKIEGVAGEFLKLMTVDGARSAGIERGAAFAIYGNGLLPVMRFQVSDEARFDAAITRIEQKADYELTAASASGNEYRYFGSEEVRFVVATIGGHAIFTAVPAAFTESQVATALGITQPEENLGASGKLESIRKKYDYVDGYGGYVDNVRIAEIFMGGATGLDKELFAVLDYETPELSEVCRTEIMQLVGIAPRLVVGYSELTGDRIDSSMVIELRDDIAKGLATVPAAVPGLGTDPGGFMSFGFGIDLLKAREFVEERVTAMEENPLVCESLHGLQSGAIVARGSLSQPIPPVAYSVHGFFANIMSIDGIDFSNDEPPESVDGTFLFAIDDAEMLLNMASGFVPNIAALNLKADGKAVKIEMDELKDVNEFGGDIYAAMSDIGIAFAIGDDAADNAEDALTAKSGNSRPLIGMSMDAAAYYELIGESMMQEKKGADAESMPVELREGLRDAMVAVGKLYKRMVFDVNLTEHGIEIDGRVTIGD